jgi:hypothetical protein
LSDPIIKFEIASLVAFILIGGAVGAVALVVALIVAAISGRL